MPDQPNLAQPPTFPDIPDIPAMPVTGTPQTPTPPPTPSNDVLNIPPMIVDSSSPKKKSGRIIATILGILLLVGAVGAGVVLVGQKQLFKQKAAFCMDPCRYDSECANGEYCYVQAWPGCSECKTKPTSCTPHCAGNIPYTCDSNGISLEGIACTGTQTCNNGVCTGGTTPTPTPTPTSPPIPTCSLSGNRICVGNDVTGPCYQGGQGGEYA